MYANDGSIISKNAIPKIIPINPIIEEKHPSLFEVFEGLVYFQSLQ